MWHPRGLRGAAVAPTDPGACAEAGMASRLLAGERAAAMYFPQYGDHPQGLGAAGQFGSSPGKLPGTDMGH
jgi:hypothetical protein